MFRITKKEEVFFNFFIETANLNYKAANMLLDLMENYKDVAKKVHDIEIIEHECDRVVHEILRQLNNSFITPIDREDIDTIAKRLDNIMDDMEAIAHRFVMYDVKSIKVEAIELAKFIVEATKESIDLMNELKNMKKSSVLKEKVIEINRIENSGDIVYRNAIKNLFKAEKDAIEVIKWKALFNSLECALDSCELVANTVEGIVMKHA